ncbi:MAG TPA: hypothetical protein VMJ32_06570 [Pirellulales bacterium]|nr:hypothetical protein [Pirellulales bacterium]
MADPTVQLRIEWGHSVDRPRQWQGEISIDQGTLSQVRPLGIEADEPGSIWSEGNHVEIHERSLRSYDGLDVLVTAPLNATLKLQFSDSLEPGSVPVVTETSLSDLVSKPLNRELDKSGNRLLVRRAPGDMLRVKLLQDHLVFSPGDTLRLDVEPKLLPCAAGTAVELRAQLLSAGGTTELGSQEQGVKTTAEETVPVSIHWEFKVPPNEGVYDVVIEAFEPPALRWTKPKPIAERHVQFIVVKDRSLPAPPDVNAAWTPIMEIDPANPHWYERFVSSSILPSLGQANFGNVALQPWQKALGSGVLIPPNGNSGEVHWQAYPLTINRPGAPHILEVEYPSDVPQTLGISIVEPNAAGAVLPIGLDSGVYLVDESIPAPAKWQRHRLIFWPRTKNPIVLLSNRREDLPAVFGKIRVLAGPGRLPRAPFVDVTLPERLLGGYLARPLIAESFGAPESLDVASGRSLGDWQTFYDGAVRLAEYMNYIGLGGQMLTVMAEGSTIYPSTLIEPTTRFDKGAFFETAQDPARKDALELIFRIFDREGLKLIPNLQFAAPLPELENRLRGGGTDAVGIQLIGSEGEIYTEKFPPSDKPALRRGIAPYYNPLNEHVQEAMLAVVRELVQRYNQHPSFAGLAIELSADSYTQMPGEMWGLDDNTIACFQRDTGIQVPAAGDTRFSQRAEFFARPERNDVVNPKREAWLKWRAAKLADFYMRLQKELTSVRPDGMFYLTATNLFDAPESQRLLRPSLPAKASMDQVLLSLGIRADLLRDQRGLVLLRPDRLEPPGSLATQGVDLELNRTNDLDEQFRGMTTSGALFLHKPQQARLSSFDAKSPFGKDKTCAEDLYAELSPADRRNRQRFVHALATSDVDFIFDGGWLMPLGQEDSLTDLFAAFRRLPVGKFETFTQSSQPVTIRTLARDNSTYAYVLNDSEWPVTVRLGLDIPPGCRIEELSGQRRLPTLSGNNWTLMMEPFDLIAVRFLAPDVHVRDAQITLDDSHLKPWLDNQVHELLERKAMLVNQPALQVLANPSFELPAKAGQIPGWSLVNPSGGSLILDPEGPPMQGKPLGKQAARLESDGRGIALHSDTFSPPATGRLSISVWLRIEDPRQQPNLWLALEGTLDGRLYYRSATVGRESNPICAHGEQWSRFQLQIDDLPATGLDKLRVRFDLVGPGRVWIDDVQLFDLAFTDTELGQLGKIVALADFQLQSGKLAECMHELDGYWPRFLSTYVTVPPPPLANQQQLGNTQPQPPTEKPASRTSGSSWWPPFH